MTDETDGIDLAVTPHPVFVSSGHFGDMRLGRIKPPEAPKLKLAKYINFDALPPRPTHVPLPIIPGGWPMYGNDLLGDCTWASVGHMVQGWTETVGGLVVPTEHDIEEGYWLTGNPPTTTGQPGGPTDDGRVETDVLGYWRYHGIPNEGHKILAYTSVERHHVREAIWLFGGVYLGIELPLTAQTQQVWDYVADDPNNAPGSWGGHAVPVLAYDRHGFIVITWGSPLRMTDTFRNVYADEIYAIITEDWLNAQQETLSGFDLAQLQADLAAVTGSPTVAAAGADLPAEPAPAATEPSQPPQAASAPEVPAQHAWNASAAPGIVTASDEEGAKTMYLRLLAENPNLVTVTPG